ncbi:helix-turn-helix domain-containing protein [Streptomyces sp. SL13]|uniref:Helix-turn-helix domain-containing protein n=1 Tax=Streptantibioticus silvisoli TaxID=2705255 RepID=A0AA90K9D7_9ACTN|nr:helix-turn-helix domain-containing protein [Streptantibioticus silvisoli]MDI5964476.1 helix-turn-helix domain-containing protein [Streptantibioticus silvisoli]MDI5970767.1 helix-turn-helix domain-containing protein [Streptantibioticus silvisoli]
MLSETVFRSEDLAVADRFDAWRACMNDTHAPLDLSSDHAADFRAHQRLIRLGEASVWPATFQQLIFRRTPKLIRQSDPEVYHLSLLVKGEARVSWGRQGAAYSAYDFHTNDSGRPYEIWTGAQPITSVGVEVPKALLPLPRNKAGQVLGRRMSGREGIGALLAQFLAQMAADTSAYRPADGPRLGLVLTDLVTALFAHTLDADSSLPPETRTRTLTLRIKSFIRRHLHDPELTPAGIAAAHHISRSYLHRLFQAEDTTVSAYVRHQRLEAARRDLVDPALRTTPVHVIAARWGFPRAADFSRAFRAAYGSTPTSHRHQAPHPGTGPGR